MIRLYLLLLFFTCTLLSSVAQEKATVSGIVFDTLNKKGVSGATITLLKKKDSSLVSFTMTDNNGQFSLRGMANGAYRILFTHVSYHNSNTYFTIDETHRNIDLGRIIMNDLSTVLPEVVVQAEAPPVTMINDTIQYNAGSFKTQPNADVEDLLKKLPGVKVEKDGTVKAQGEKVNKVLVDGKEFFGNDPKIATRNLPADAVDKVQVYDRMSEQAQLTGFDDGNSEKTINLKLKKDKKKGLFGKASVGHGTNERYEGKFNVNSFKGARQFSAIGMGNNANAEGFSFIDMLNFTGELNRLRQGGGGGNISINITPDDPNAGLLGGNNNGINTTLGGGFNYNNIIGQKTDFQSNYFYNRFNPKTESHSERQYLLPDSSYFFNQDNFTDRINNNHRLNLNADIFIDSFRSIRISPSFSYQDTKTSSRSQYNTLSEENILSNSGFSNSISNNNGYNFRSDFLFRNKFRLKGRTFSLSLQTSLNNSNGNGSLESINRFFDMAGNNFRTDSINQRNTTEAALRGYTARAVYTEPILKRSLLEFSYANSNTRSTSDKITHDYNLSNGKYDQLNPLLSNNFENTYGYNLAGIRLRTQKRKYNYAFGVGWQQASLEGKVIAGAKDSVIRKDFRNFLPYARLQYFFTRYRSLVLSYSANTNQPTVTQLQPVPDNSNSLNIRVGNPDLKQEYSHNVRLQFTSLNPFKNKNLFVFLNLGSTDNKIVNYDEVDTLGIKTTRPVNVNGVYNMNGDISLGLPLRFVKGTINISSSALYSRNKNFINGRENTVDYWMLGPDIRIDMNLGEKATLSVNGRYAINFSKFTLQPSLNTTYFSQQYGTEFDWQLPKNFFFATDFTYSINSQRAAGFNSKVPFWNASFSKQFLRFNRGELKIRAYDLLNQNIGISRTSNQNYIEDLRIQNLRRYFMLTFTYSLNKNGLGQRAGGGALRILSR